ncbi:DUF5131 family protein [Rhodobacter capsulatus]|uniref:DUF5131 family protein n=1 Tax=Rhodobacter capsulatus TaxID=1061 RepID=UPI004029118D
MADKSLIGWTDATWNIITGCSMVSAGCTNCYAMGLAASRLQHHPSRAGLTRETGGRAVWTGEVRFNEGWLDQPLRWRAPRRIFVCAHGDLFHESVPDEWIDRVFAVMALCPQHTFQVLTKRPERMREYVTGDAVSRIVRAYAKRLRSRGHGECKSLTAFDIACDRIGLVEDFEHADIVPKLENRGLARGWPLPNVWLGTSIEDQFTADARIPHLLQTPAAIKFVSAEPLLGALDLRAYMPGCYECGGGCGTRLAQHPAIDRCVPCQEEYGQESGAVEFCPACGSSEWEPVCPDCNHYMVQHHPDTPCLDLVIVGGESGPRARPMHPDWVRSLRDQCVSAGVAFHFKQWGEWAPRRAAHETDLLDARKSLIIKADGGTTSGLLAYGPDAWLMDKRGKRAAGRLLDGRTWDEMPGGRNAA